MPRRKRKSLAEFAEDYMRSWRREIDPDAVPSETKRRSEPRQSEVTRRRTARQRRNRLLAMSDEELGRWAVGLLSRISRDLMEEGLLITSAKIAGDMGAHLEGAAFRLAAANNLRDAGIVMRASLQAPRLNRARGEIASINAQLAQRRLEIARLKKHAIAAGKRAEIIDRALVLLKRNPGLSNSKLSEILAKERREPKETIRQAFKKMRRSRAMRPTSVGSTVSSLNALAVLAKLGMKIQK